MGYLRVDDTARTALAAEMLSRTVDLREILNSEIDVARLAECVRRGFEEEWAIAFRVITSDEEREWTDVPTAYAGG